jgi:multiple sugar transport system permease protein
VSTEAAPARAAAAPATFVRRRPPVAVRRKRFLVGGRDSQPADRRRDRVPAPVRVHPADLADDEPPGALAPALAGAVRWHNYIDVFSKAPLWRYALNTLLYGGLATLGLLISSIPVAYALSRLRWRGRDAVFLITLVALMLPPQVTIVPSTCCGEAAPRRLALAADRAELAR